MQYLFRCPLPRQLSNLLPTPPAPPSPCHHPFFLVSLQSLNCFHPDLMSQWIMATPPSSISFWTFLLLKTWRHDATKDYAIANLVLPEVEQCGIASHYSHNRKLQQSHSWPNLSDGIYCRARLMWSYAKLLLTLMQYRSVHLWWNQTCCDTANTW